ncbi:thiamine diphosphokinase [Niallia sp. 01092]|uniref:thiamine diphosphokinase n=1 Tax=unclassified Niallia TaxID=2837522 RepID=UPI003FD3BDB7
MDIHIMAGGPENNIPMLAEYLYEDAIWIGVDRGVLYLLQRGIPVDTAFGDFDSVNEQEWLEIKQQAATIKKFKPEKDETDMELALNWATQKQPNTIRLFGATGGRLDHTIANLQLLLKEIVENEQIHIEIIDHQNIVYLVKEGTYSIKGKENYPYVSFFPYSTNIIGLTLEGFKYPLNDRHIPISSTLCISNELISDYGTFSFTKGILMVIRSHD